jgi:sec-independent protein translocase protein TatA
MLQRLRRGYVTAPPARLWYWHPGRAAPWKGVRTVLGTGELIIVLVVVLLVFGANKIPQLGDGLGKAIRNFKKGMGGEPPAGKPPGAGEPPRQS